MVPTALLGVLVVVVSGAAIGASLWPIKCMRRFEYEHWGFISMVAGLIVAPWAVTLLACPDAVGAYRSVGCGVLLKSNLCSLSWGIANILYMLCFAKIGVSLANGIMAGVSVSVGVTTPMVLKGTGVFQSAAEVFSPAGLTVLGGVAATLFGVILVSLAGLERERARTQEQRSPARFWGGLAMALSASVLSAGFSFAFVYSQGPILKAMAARGAGDIPANVSVWAAALFAGAVLNVVYPAYLMTKHKSWNLLWHNPGDLGLAVTLGLMFFVGTALMGKGMLLLGALGASVGFGVQQTVQLLGSQAVGFFSGEWRGIGGKPVVRMYCAILVFVLAAAIMACVNAINAGN